MGTAGEANVEAVSQEELVDAYVTGGMSRRLFVRRLVAGGMALGTAVSYAHLLTPERASAKTQAFANGYDPPQITSLAMIPDDLDRVIRRKRVRVRATADQPSSFVLYLHLYRSPQRSQWPDALIGGTTFTFNAANTPQTFVVPIWDGSPVYALEKQRKSARIGIHPSDGDASPVAAHAILYRR
jgi:hypothetical protein